jgi:transcriptional regulator with XRE-family HTH domain
MLAQFESLPFRARMGISARMKLKPNRIAEIRKKRGLSMEKLAEKLNTSRGQIFQLETGKRKLTHEWMLRLAQALQCRPEDFITSLEKTVPVVGYVGAGAKVYPIDDHALGEGLEQVECPPGYDPDLVVALCVRGDSMLPMLRDGWLIFYSRDVDGVPQECINRICVVKMPDDSIMVKEVRQGSKAWSYHLISHNADPIFDTKLIWATRVIDIRPT